jgi:hypothetical protein
MSLAFNRDAHFDRAVAVLRAGIVARDLCRRARRGEVAAVFDRCLYLRIGAEFVCVGEPAIGNGPTTLIVAARMAELGVLDGEPPFVSNRSIAIGDLLLDLNDCVTWRPPEWPGPCAPAQLLATCAALACRAASESPPDSLARAIFAAEDMPFTRLARPRVAEFEAWISKCRVGKGRAAAVPTRKYQRRVGTRPAAALPTLRSRPLSRGMTREEFAAKAVRDLVGLGPGLTPSGDDFLIGALAALDGLNQTNMHATLGRAIVAAAGRTSPLSASFLRAATAGHVGEKLHTMVAALIGGNADASIAAAERIGHTSGWDALAGAVVAVQAAYRC